MDMYARLRRMLLWGISAVLGACAIGIGLNIGLHALDQGPFELFWLTFVLVIVGVGCVARAIVEMCLLVFEQFKVYRAEQKTEAS